MVNAFAYNMTMVAYLRIQYSHSMCKINLSHHKRKSSESPNHHHQHLSLILLIWAQCHKLQFLGDVRMKILLVSCANRKNIIASNNLNRKWHANKKYRKQRKLQGTDKKIKIKKKHLQGPHNLFVRKRSRNNWKPKALIFHKHGCIVTVCVNRAAWFILVFITKTQVTYSTMNILFIRPLQTNLARTTWKVSHAYLFISSHLL